MRYSLRLANKIRTKLLLFVDEEMRAKANNNPSKNKTKKKFNPIGEIKTDEETFSNTQEDNIIYFHKMTNLNPSPKSLLNTYCKLRNKIEQPIICSKFKSENSVRENPKNNDISSNNSKYLYQSYKKKTNKLTFKKINKNKKRKSKEYLKNLCKNLINKSKLNKYRHSNTTIPKKMDIYVKSPKSKRLNKKIEKNKTLDQSSNNIDSFQIILFVCGY